MLYFETVSPSTLQLIKDLQSMPLLSETRLVGGTSLALQIGHRKSIDIDLFGRLQCESIALKSLSYFDDAEKDPMPYMFSQMDWDSCKKGLLIC